MDERAAGTRVTGDQPVTGLSASFAHEINNPLDSILNLLYLLEGEATFSDKGRHYLLLVQEEVRRVADIARQALSHHRDTSQKEATDVAKLLDNELELYRSRFEARGISVETRYCPNGQFPVYPGPLRQVFSNLLLNAGDAMPGGGRMQVRVCPGHEWCGEERHGVRVTIADNGSGISTTNLPKIFDSFFTTKGSAGNGMGLAVVREIVKKHKGRLHVRSSTQSGHSGTVFNLFLPDQQTASN